MASIAAPWRAGTDQDEIAITFGIKGQEQPPDGSPRRAQAGSGGDPSQANNCWRRESGQVARGWQARAALLNSGLPVISSPHQGGTSNLP